MRDVFNTFTSMCQSNYTCNFFLLVDKQLMPLKSRCSFITFMPSKPDKYGIKFWDLVDVKSKHIANITPYLNVQEKKKRGNIPLGEPVAVKITEHIKDKEYNICCDNFITLLLLAEKLQQAKFSLVGTTKKSRRDLSQVITEPKKACANSRNFFWHKKNAMLLKYQPKTKNQSVFYPPCILCQMLTPPQLPKIHV